VPLSQKHAQHNKWVCVYATAAQPAAANCRKKEGKTRKMPEDTGATRWDPNVLGCTLLFGPTAFPFAYIISHVILVSPPPATQTH